MYHIPQAGGVAATSGLGAASLPSDGPLSAVHQALAFTGFAFGAYVALAIVLIFAGLVLRHFAGHGATSQPE